MWTLTGTGYTASARPAQAVMAGGVCYPPNSPLWVETPDPAPPAETLAAAQARRLAELAGDYRAAFDVAVPVPTRIEIERGLREPGGQDALDAVLIDFRDVYEAAAGSIGGAASVADVNAATWTWPEVTIE